MPTSRCLDVDVLILSGLQGKGQWQDSSPDPYMPFTFVTRTRKCKKGQKRFGTLKWQAVKSFGTPKSTVSMLHTEEQWKKCCTRVLSKVLAVTSGQNLWHPQVNSSQANARMLMLVQITHNA